MLAMSGMGFGQKEAKLLWEREDNYLKNDVPYTPLEVTPSGKTIVTIVSGFTGTIAGYKIFDKTGKDITSPYGKNTYTLKRGKNISWVSTKDSLYLFDEDLALIKVTKHFINSTLSFEVENGIIFYSDKDVFKCNFKGEKLWQYTSTERIIEVVNKAISVFRTEGGNYLYLDSNGKEKIKISSKGTKGVGFNGGNMYVLKSVDLGFWLIGSKEIHKYDLTGTQTGYIDFDKEKIDSSPYFNFSGSVITNDNFTYEGYSSSFIVVAHQKQDSTRFIKIDSSGKYQITTIKDGRRQFEPYNSNVYMADDNRVMFHTNLVSGLQSIGVCNFKEPTKSWIKQLPDTDQFYEFVDNTFVMLNNKSKEPVTDRNKYSGITLYDLSGQIKLLFKDDNTYYPVTADSKNYLYINHGLFFSKIKTSDGIITWKKDKPFGSDDYSHSFRNDSDGNDYWIYSTANNANNHIDLILKSTNVTSRFFTYPKRYSANRSNLLIDRKNQILMIITNGENNNYQDHILRKYSTQCLNDLNIPTLTGNTEACPTEKIKLSIQKQEGVTYQWQKDGKDLPSFKDAVYDIGESGTYTVNVKDEICQNQATSNALKISIRSLPNVEIKTAKITFCEGDKTTITATTNGVFFQWQKDQKDVPNAITGIFEATQAGDYRVGVRDDKCPQVGYSNTYTINVKPLPEASISTDIKTVIYEPFTVKMTANSGTNLSYQWLKDEVIIDNATTNIYEAKKSGKYKVSVTKDGCLKTSEALTISIQIPLANESEIGEETVQIYPNPSQGKFKIVLPKTLQNAEIQLFDILGRERSVVHTGEQAQADGLVQGVYFLRVNKGEKSILNKIVIE